MISRILSCKFLHIQIASVSGHSLHFILKTCQIVARTSIIRQFHEFFNIVFGEFLTFGTTVICARALSAKFHRKLFPDKFFKEKTYLSNNLIDSFLLLTIFLPFFFVLKKIKFHGA